MTNICAKRTSGGKGNLGMFIERDKKVCAAGLPSAQGESFVEQNMKHYLLQEEVDALIGDAVKPLPKVTPVPTLRHSMPRDMRNAGSFSEGALLINPLTKSKFECVVDDLKETCYNSYWKQRVGKYPDPTPNLPIGYDIYNTTCGKKTEFHGNLYDIVLPKNQIPGELRRSKCVAYQTDRNYCKSSYNSDIAFGMRTLTDKRGRCVKCCLTHETRTAIPTSQIQATFRKANQPQLARSMAPYDNIRCVPEGFTFGKAEKPSIDDTALKCFTMCELNPDRLFFKECLAHLNTVRKCLSKRFDVSFFKKFYSNVKYYDKDFTGWLPKQIIYDYCVKNYIRFDTSLIEPLLSAWNIFDGSKIEYKTFAFILNFTQVPPDLPKVPDISDECLDFRTTYGEMVKPDQEIDKGRRAGLPSGKYFEEDYPVTPDGLIRADRNYLPHESDARACLNPSLFTNFGVSHRDMYAKREPHIIKKVFEATGDRFTDEEFNIIWKAAEKYHPKKYVSYETFYRVLKEKQSQMPEK